MRRFFYNIFGIFLIILSQSPVESLAHPQGDPWTAHYMWRRYYNTTADCGKGNTLPAYMCVGIIMRGTSPEKEGDHAWWPEKKSFEGVSSGGVSFSYIRQDTLMQRLAFSFQNGFTLYPSAGKYQAPAGKIALKVLCAFPFDGSTDTRDSKGCGYYPQQEDSKPCLDIGIDSTDLWLNKYLSKVSYLYGYICGFTMETEKNKDLFDIVMNIPPAIKRKLNSVANINNELRIETWEKDEDTSKKLPLESFFYIDGSTDGRKNAQHDQYQYYKDTGLFVPVIKVTAPDSVKSTNFDFHYEKSDQSPDVIIPVFQYPDPNPCKVGDFDEKC